MLRDVIHGLLGKLGGSVDQALIILECLDPIVQVLGVILAWLGADAQHQALKRSAQLGNQFLEGVAVVVLDVESVEARLVTSSVSQLVKLGRVKALGRG